MSVEIGFIKAETHTPEYLMHKYWARKPHNVIHECIKALTTEGNTVLDPFCGSGVTLRESALLGRKCYGFDLNPAAVLITTVLLNPPNVKEFSEAFEEIYNKVFERFSYLYKTQEGKTIKFLSHRIIAKCTCGKHVNQAQCKKVGKKFFCPSCKKVVHFNLESLVDTEIFNIAIDGDNLYEATNSELENQKILSSYCESSVNTEQYDLYFPKNRRILSFEGIHTSSFFTKRNFLILSLFANEIFKIANKKIRDCALLLLTASSVQCSRLIASRSNLSTGGPAWSVPGFWVPKEHLETNPFVHIKARFAKIKKGLIALLKNPAKTESEVFSGNSLELLTSDSFVNLKADLIFLDPPYGDSVPYTEFSNIWNSFLKSTPCFDDDISVSDRIDKTKSWNNYSYKLNQYMDCFSRHLTENGKLLITFNNNDMKAWTSLIAALQNNGFVCQSVFYQIPAVISSKAQMSLTSSYISDVYSVYIYDPKSKPSNDLSPLLKHLCKVANSRGGTLLKTILDREFIISWLNNNIDYSILSEKDDIIAYIFEFSKVTNTYTLKPQYVENVPLLRDLVKSAMLKLNETGTHSFLDSYLEINAQFKELGTLELGEFKDFISDFTVENNTVNSSAQLSLF